MTSTLSDHSSEIYSDVLRSVRMQLDLQGSVLVEDESVFSQFESQVTAILTDVIHGLEGKEASISKGLEDPADSLASTESAFIGRSRAGQNIHPWDSLAAANVLFDVALPVIICAYSRTLARDSADPSGIAQRVARELQRSIMERITPASVGYVDALLEKLSAAQSEERLRVSRELHDRVAHGIAAALQRVSLSQTAGADASGTEVGLLSAAESILRSALEDTRRIALDLRQTVGDRLLDDAVRDYLSDIALSSPRAEVRSLGVPRYLSNGASEEVFLIVREAIRNALEHSGCHSMVVIFDWGSADLVINITDDGGGFGIADVGPKSMGLLTMRERAEVLGADFVIESGNREGTTITLTISLDSERA